MEIGMFFLMALTVITIIGMRAAIKRRDETILELQIEIYKLRFPEDKRPKLPTNEDGVYSESIESGDSEGVFIESGDIHGSD